MMDLPNGLDFATEILGKIEEECNGSIKRIPIFDRKNNHSFDITIIFSDYRMYQGVISVEMFYGMPSVRVTGNCM